METTAGPGENKNKKQWWNMSGLIEKLIKQRQAEPQPMGFAAFSRPAAEKPRLQLLVYLPAETQIYASDLINSADAVLVVMTRPDDIKSVEKVCQARGDMPVGGWIRFSDPSVSTQTGEASNCDFVIFPSSIPAIVTGKEKPGRIMELNPDLSEGLLRTVNDLPVDAVMVTPAWPGKNLTLSHLMQVRRLVLLINKPLLVSIPEDFSQPDLQSLWDMGVSGVTVGPADEKLAGKLPALRKQIEALAPSSLRKKERASPILPHIQPEMPAPPEGGEEEEDE